MAYNINGKVYTDHPLMDEIIYNCKIILNEIVIKNDVLANDNEEAKYIDDAELFVLIKDNNVSFNAFPFTSEILKAFGYDREAINLILEDKENVPKEDRSELLEFASNYFIDNYEEKNNYYRMLNGLPMYGTDEYYVYIDESYMPANFEKTIDFSKPIHELDKSVISILKINGKIDQLIETYKGSNYSYLRFLGHSKIDVYKARKANKYDILSMPSVETLVYDRFIELYNLNRDIYLKRTYSEAYAYGSDYYEQCMIIMILAQTFNDMIVDVPQWYIRRDIFDIRSVQYFLDSYGVQFFKEIPLKYQIRIVKNLNKLVKYKSSNKNFTDILEIFSLKNTSIFKYYLFKKRLKDSSGNYVSSEKEEEKYELEFVQAKINDSYDNYIKDMIYRTPYDDITYQDKYWDGEDEHSYVKLQHLLRDFTIEDTKYMSIEYKISMSEYLFQVQYFVGLVMDSKVDSDDLRISIPSIETKVSFNLSDLFLFLVLLTLGYNNCSTDVNVPEVKSSNYNKKYDVKDELYDWMKDKVPEIFEPKQNRIYAFNSKVNIDDIEKSISKRHSKFQFNNGFSITDIGVDKFIVPKSISSIDELMNIYFTNKECYDNLKKKLIENVDNRDEFRTLNYVFEELFTSEFDYDYYKINNYKDNADKLDKILKDHDYVLYSTYLKIMSETNMESRRDLIRGIMNDVVNTLEYYISGEGLEYVFSFCTVNSFTSLINYIYLMINFFKSYKVYFLDPFITYLSDDKLENNATAYDAIMEKKLDYIKWDKHFARDTKNIESKYIFDDEVRKNILESVNLYRYFDPDNNDDYDYDGMYANTTGDYKDANGGYADGKISIPFIMLDAGAAYKESINLWDLDGNNANLDSNDDIFDVDAGYSLDPESIRKDYWGTAFNYLIDGGDSSTDEFISKISHIQILDNQIKPEISVFDLNGYNKLIKDASVYLQESWNRSNDIDNYTDESYAILDQSDSEVVNIESRDYVSNLDNKDYDHNSKELKLYSYLSASDWKNI